MKENENLTKERYNVGGMTCSACSAHVEKAVSKVDGVEKVEVNLLTNSMTVLYDSKICSQNDIIDAVVQGGYTAALPSESRGKADNAKREKTAYNL